jgi:allantoate deiminase
MLFVRCKKGISHNPAESVQAGDARVAVEVLADFISRLADVGQASRLSPFKI